MDKIVLEGLGGTASAFLNTMVMVVGILIAGGIAFGIAWWANRTWFKYNYHVQWWDANDDTIGGYDKGGIFIDRTTRNKRFYLKNASVGLSPDNIPYKLMDSGILGGRKKVVYLIRYGLKNFAFANIRATSNPGVHIAVSEEDVNWATDEWKRAVNLWTNNFLTQILPYIGLIFMGAVILIISIYLIKQWDVIPETLKTMEAVSRNLADASTGTQVI